MTLDLSLTTGTIAISISKDYGYVLLSVVLIAFQIFMFGITLVNKERSSVFNKKFLTDNFGEEH
jgi:hypothetical protein